jgi:hypothetical protein
MVWPFANIGSTVAVLEAAASAVGAGLVVGGFAGGIAGAVLRWPRAKAEREVLRSSYAVGALGLGFLAIDIVRKHFV